MRYVTFQNTPLTTQMMNEAARIVAPDGRIDLWVDPECRPLIGELAELVEGVLSAPKKTEGQPLELVSVVEILGMAQPGTYVSAPCFWTGKGRNTRK